MAVTDNAPLPTPSKTGLSRTLFSKFKYLYLISSEELKVVKNTTDYINDKYTMFVFHILNRKLTVAHTNTGENGNFCQHIATFSCTISVKYFQILRLLVI